VKEMKEIVIRTHYRLRLRDINMCLVILLVTFASKDWNSFPQSVMLALAGRRDLTVVFQYDYEGRTYKVTISAGTPIHTGDNWYGPMRLVDLYDGVEITE